MPRERLDPLTATQKALVEQNCALAIDYATSHHRRGDRLTLDELISCSFLALCYAARTYDPAAGAFSTHSYSWMRRFRSEELASLHLVHVPKCAESCTDPIRREHAEKGRKMRRRPGVLDLPETRNLPSIETVEIVEAMHKNIAAFPATYQHVARRRLLDEETLAVVAEEMGRTKERANQIAKAIIKKLQFRMRQYA